MRLNSPQINLISKACIKASRSLIRDFGEIENLQVSSKGPGDFVSSADKRTEKILIEELQKAHPEYGIITEETGIINKSNTTNRWIIDGGGHFIPAANDTYDIGSSSARVRNIYTQDLQLSNEARKDTGGNDVDGTWGDWTLQEGEEEVFMINNRTGKKYAMMLREVA